MTNEEIKSECEKMYQQIKDANNRLDELRKKCKHEETFEGLYEIRPGSIHNSVICKFCGSWMWFVESDKILNILKVD